MQFTRRHDLDPHTRIEIVRHVWIHQVSALRADFARPSYAWRSSNLALKAILSARVVSWAVPHPRSLQRLGGYRAGDHNARA